MNNLIVLGFWLYAVFGLLVAGPLYGDDMSSKVAVVTAGVFGIAFHGVLAALLLGALECADIEASFIIVFALLLILVVAMLVRFRVRLKGYENAVHLGGQ